MSGHTPTVRCRNTAFGELDCTIINFSVASAVCQRLIDDWKDAVPHRSRSYDRTSRVWRFASAFADLAIEIALRHFPTADVPAHWRRRPFTSDLTDAGSDHFRVLHLRETAPIELIEASYRVMARLHHPDRGGDMLTMQRINGAYAALKARVTP